MSSFFKSQPIALKKFKQDAWKRMSKAWRILSSVEMLEYLGDWWLQNVSKNSDTDFDELTKSALNWVEEVGWLHPEFVPLDYESRFEHYMINSKQQENYYEQYRAS